jgi:hypothetical protein
MAEFVTYKTSSPAGDLISFLAGMQQIWMDLGKKAVIYQRLGMVGMGHAGSVHPFENEEKEPVCMNQYMFDMLRPLIISQPYVHSYEVFKGEDVQIDLDKIRMEQFTNQPLGSLNRWPAYAFPEMACDLSQKWVHIPERLSTSPAKIIINFTQRYRNHFVHYFFLKQYQEDLVFAGLQKERDAFCKTWDLDIPLLQVDNFYELAREIKFCKFFAGNQSFCFQLAESLKVPRILETFQLMPNVIPIGERAYDFYHQQAAEYYFNKLSKGK